MQGGYTVTQMDVFFRANQWEGTIVNNEPDKCDELRFFPLNSLPDNMVPSIRYAIQSIKNQALFSEFGWD